MGTPIEPSKMAQTEHKACGNCAFYATSDGAPEPTGHCFTDPPDEFRSSTSSIESGHPIVHAVGLCRHWQPRSWRETPAAAH